MSIPWRYPLADLPAPSVSRIVEGTPPDSPAPPSWQITWPYGYPQAVDSAGSVAAPLLAGFSVTLLGIAIASSTGMRWANEAMAVLATATAFLIFAVQAAFNAKRWMVTPADLLAWWPNPDVEPGMAQLCDWQAQHKKQHDKWAAWFRWSYNIGLMLLLLGVAVCLVPPQVGTNSPRWVACGIAGGTALAEAAWVFLSWWSERRATKKAHDAG